MRLGVVGHGARISGVIKWNLRGVEPELRVVGIVDPNRERATSLLEEVDKQDAVFYESLDEMARKGNLDALAIGTRCNLHAPYAVEAAKYDLPLYLEKPVATSMEQATALEAAFENSRCRVVVSFPLRVSLLCEEARKLIAEGAVGAPEHILGVNYVPYGTCYWDQDYRFFEITQGLFLQKATHDFDYMSYLMGSNITRVAAMAQYGRVFGGDKPAGLWCSKCDETESCLESPKNRKRSFGGAQNDHQCLFGVDCGTPETGTNEDASSALLEFASGAKGVYTQVFYTRRDAATRGATVSGYHGTVGFDWYTGEMKRVRHFASLTDVSKVGQGAAHFGGDDELAHDFIDLVKGRKQASRTSIETGIQSVYACLAARESAEKGIFVDVRQVGAYSKA